ncbi:MAG: carboxypeptidase-like regulatory domain-containing protein [Alistipes sp.]|jgi:hypothetical protein|nr:carboxypeptidase-like regulatory domain-containing protein [Alistipes sp.]
MKTSLFEKLFSLTAVVLLVAAALPAHAQERDDIFTVSGTVRDNSTRRPVAGVSLMVPDSRVGTVTNADGTFSLKVRRDLGARAIEFSHLGYVTRRVPVGDSDLSGVTVLLAPGTIELEGVTVYNREARRLVEEAIDRIDDNYLSTPALLTGFYRETVRKRNIYIDIAEAVTEIYRSPYAGGGPASGVRIVKGRRLVSPRPNDTLAVKLQGGPVIYTVGDIVANREIVIDPESLDDYIFALGPPAMIDDRAHFTVDFEPGRIYSEWVLHRGRLHIDMETLTVSRAEYSLDMSNRDKVTGMILRRKPASLRFIPQEVSYVLSYREREGRSYLYYVGVDIRFRCDWRRRLLATSYTVSSEMVITDGRTDGVAPIPFRETFRSGDILSERVSDFSGPEFWESYNIIEPTESLENAARRLLRRMEN